MKKSLSLLVGAIVPAILFVGACGDDVYDAEPGDQDVDASRRDATDIPPARDAAADARTDGRADADPDGDTPDVDVPDVDVPDVEVPLTPPSTFVSALEAAYCANYDRCCATDPNTPAAGATCAASVQDPGFFSGLFDAYYQKPEIATSSRVRVDEAAMTACLANVNALGCINVEDQVTATAWRGVLEQCSAALYGVGVDGDPCLSDIECDKTTSCRGAAQGTGICTTLSTAGQGGNSSGPLYSDSCSYRGYGQQQANPAVPPLHVDHTSVCAPLRATGQRCFEGPDPYAGFDVNCESRACSADDEANPTGLYCSDFKNDLYRCVYALP